MPLDVHDGKYLQAEANRTTDYSIFGHCGEQVHGCYQTGETVDIVNLNPLNLSFIEDIPTFILNYLF